MATYSSNPSSYQQLLAAGVSPSQIREAINSGLNPSQLPPEYFGLGSGYTPQSVGPGSTPVNQIGGIDIPPASMVDPYATPTPQSPGSMGNFGTTPTFGFPNNFDLGNVPSSSTSYLGVPGSTPSQNAPFYPYTPFTDFSSGYTGTTPGSLGSFGTTPSFGFPTDFSLGSTPSSTTSYLGIPGYSGPSLASDSSSSGLAGSGSLSYADPTPIPFSDPGSVSVGGDMTLGGYGTTPEGPAGMQFQTDPSASGTIGDFSYVPQPGTNTYDAGNGTTYVYDSDWNYLYTQQSPFAGAQGTATGTVTGSPSTGSPSTSGVPGGTGPMSPFSSWGGYQGPPVYTAAPGYGLTGVGMNTVPSSGYSTGWEGRGMYGLGAMNASPTGNLGLVGELPGNFASVPSEGGEGGAKGRSGVEPTDAQLAAYAAQYGTTPVVNTLPADYWAKRATWSNAFSSASGQQRGYYTNPSLPILQPPPPVTTHG